jgi:hypothetical protein
MTTSVNSAYFQSPTFEYPGNQQQYGGANQSQIESDIEQLLNDLGMPGGSMAGPTGTFPGNCNGTGNGTSQYPVNGYPGATQTGNPPLRSIKLSSRSGAELDLLEDPSGNLYDQDGKSVGRIGSDGSVSFNQDGKKDAQNLATDGKSPWQLLFNGGLVQGKEGSDGSYTFSPDQVTISAGDLNLGSTGTTVTPATSAQEV